MTASGCSSRAAATASGPVATRRTSNRSVGNTVSNERAAHSCAFAIRTTGLAEAVLAGCVNQRSWPKSPRGHLLRALSMHEAPDDPERPEVVVGDFIVVDRDAEFILHEGEQLDHAHRIHDAAAHQRVRIGELEVLAHVEEVVGDVAAKP